MRIVRHARTIRASGCWLVILSLLAASACSSLKRQYVNRCPEDQPPIARVAESFCVHTNLAEESPLEWRAFDVPNEALDYVLTRYAGIAPSHPHFEEIRAAAHSGLKKAGKVQIELSQGPIMSLYMGYDRRAKNLVVVTESKLVGLTGYHALAFSSDGDTTGAQGTQSDSDSARPPLRWRPVGETRPGVALHMFTENILGFWAEPGHALLDPSIAVPAMGTIVELVARSDNGKLQVRLPDGMLGWCFDDFVAPVSDPDHLQQPGGDDGWGGSRRLQAALPLVSSRGTGETKQVNVNIDVNDTLNRVLGGSHE